MGGGGLDSFISEKLALPKSLHFLFFFKKKCVSLALSGPEPHKRSEATDEMPHDAVFHQGLHCSTTR